MLGSLFFSWWTSISLIFTKVPVLGQQLRCHNKLRQLRLTDPTDARGLLEFLYAAPSLKSLSISVVSHDLISSFLCSLLVVYFSIPSHWMWFDLTLNYLLCSVSVWLAGFRLWGTGIYPILYHMPSRGSWVSNFWLRKNSIWSSRVFVEEWKTAKEIFHRYWFPDRYVPWN